MKKIHFFPLILVIMAITISACMPGGDATPASATSTTAPAAAATEPATEPAVEATASSGVSEWALPGPRDANQLPNELSPAIKYIDPPVNCAKENDPNVTCSTIRGQNTSGDFTLKAGQAIVMTGDAIEISKAGSSESLASDPSLDTVHDLWVVVNETDKDMELHMEAPHGSFRGYFETVDGQWNGQEVAHLRDLHLYLFLLPTQTEDRFTPTPVPNCESQYGCDMVNVRAIVFDESGIHVVTYGLYMENQPFWQDLLQFLGQ